MPLPPLSLASQPVSGAQSGVSSSGGLDLIQPVITLGFGGDSGDAGDIASSVVANLARQTRQLTARGTVLGDLGIGPDTLATLAVTVGVAVVVIVMAR